ncbi:hypothetical protein L484_023202 [Morus notabilis]|uniref:Uncharacterized protein n=1 Tax=Morus notabilis TaxID=981085 RepID=W9S9C9_9ROSA|nr:hypothetical protein L484_023202 [Morus notabilis]
MKIISEKIPVKWWKKCSQKKTQRSATAIGFHRQQFSSSSTQITVSSSSSLSLFRFESLKD